MKPRGWAVTDVGRKREHNEGSFACNDELQLYAVADGMGGHLGGERASRMAVEILEREMTARLASVSRAEISNEAMAQAAFTQAQWNVLQAELSALVQTYRLHQTAAHRREKMRVAGQLAQFNAMLVETVRHKSSPFDDEGSEYPSFMSLACPRLIGGRKA